MVKAVQDRHDRSDLIGLRIQGPATQSHDGLLGEGNAHAHQRPRPILGFQLAVAYESG